jgi:hypothetical protein
MQPLHRLAVAAYGFEMPLAMFWLIVSGDVWNLSDFIWPLARILRPVACGRE